MRSNPILLLAGFLTASPGIPAGELPPGMVLVPGGPFTLGYDGGDPDEKPAREAALDFPHLPAAPNE